MAVEQIGKYTVFRGDELGRGGFGTVYRARHEDGRIMAVKMLTMKHHKRSAILEATNFLKRPIDHENIVQLLDIVRPPPHYDLYIYSWSTVQMGT